ncbi:hypothetical protein K491DRAFT_678672 [Lophiostoma macrostomum CBS 122681]|uniref:Uncharacterized protein n=1 Tax=Lophiostoma macrostomum CBS 122681 TaxID=1314788 RepID=A0A6A6T7X7_9PLEO|nr:hypothetical protein K491DRAFT_678672 [Lophiostoma macrostomum CBS 122681]
MTTSTGRSNASSAPSQMMPNPPARRKTDPARAHHLFLPTFIDAKREHQDWLKYHRVYQSAEPAYIEQCNNIILLPRFYWAIAMIRAWEIKKERYLISEIHRKCDSSPFKMHCKITHNKTDSEIQDIKNLAIKCFEHLLRHDYGILHVDMRIMACLATHLSLAQNYVSFDVATNQAYFDAPYTPTSEYEEIYAEARDKLTDMAALDLIYDFLDAAPIRYRRNRKSITKLETTARRIWVKLYQRSVFPAHERWNFRGAIVAACIEQALVAMQISSSKSESKHDRDLLMGHEAVMRVMKVKEGSFSAGRIQGVVKRFCSGTDWTVPVGRRRDARRGMKRELKKVEMETAEIDGALSALAKF